MFKFAKKLKNLKYEIKDCFKKQFGNIQDKLSKNSAKLAYVEEKLLVDASSHRLNSWIQWLLKQREKNDVV